MLISCQDLRRFCELPCLDGLTRCTHEVSIAAALQEHSERRKEDGKAKREENRRQETAKNSKKRRKRTESKEKRMSAWNACKKEEKQTLQMSEAVKAICVDGGEG